MYQHPSITGPPYQNLAALPPQPLPMARPFSHTESPLTQAVEGENQDVPGKAKEPVEVGMTAETKDLYRQDHRWPWQEWAPEQIEINTAATADSAKFALIVRREKQFGDTDEPVLALHSITVQSPLIKEQLGKVFEGYRGINTNLKKLLFKAPFHEFFYRWEKVLQPDPEPTKGGDEKAAHYKLLLDVIAAEIGPHHEQAQDLKGNGVITFDYVWALFPPGAEIYSKVDGHDRLFALESGEYQEYNGERSYSLSCRFVDTDGEVFGYRKACLTIDEFQNVKPISELSAIPSDLEPGISEIRERLKERGQQFERLKGCHHKVYSGAYKLANPSLGEPRKQYVTDERVLIDSDSFLKYNDERMLPLESLDGPASPNTKGARLEDPNELEFQGFASYPIAPETLMPHMSRGNLVTPLPRPSSSWRRPKVSNSQNLSEEHYRLCTHVVRGFCLNAKEWGHLDIDLVREISWDSAAFDQLVLPGDYKRVIRAFVATQMSGEDDFDDVITGKGRGIIMLLSGEPGTGKTLTSESVAESMQKPLYGMSAGELGNDAREVEQSLHRVLELSTKWGAVLLLDECDVFLERRSSSDLQRNKLVSIFLRLLEYYQGVMFLTTNRVASFDPAFESRIHLTIDYPKLNFDSRRHVWETFLRRGSETSRLSDDDIEKLAGEELNGRQIKNVVKTARLLATSEGTSIALTHIETVLKIKRDNGKSAMKGDYGAS
ncbi:hypothetical protein ACJ41O_006213 [Fusarium nematophilum]